MDREGGYPRRSRRLSHSRRSRAARRAGAFDRCADRIWIVSNNSTATAKELADQLKALGLTIERSRILAAGEETLRTLAEDQAGARVAVYGTPSMTMLAKELGLRPDRDQPDVAVLARDTSFTFDDLAQLIALVHGGVPLILTNPDPAHPGADGMPVPETGALWAAVAAAAPGTEHRCLGKPSPELIRRALSRAGVSPKAAVFIGDTPETDGAAALAAGVEFVLLRRPGAALADLPVGAVQC